MFPSAKAKQQKKVGQLQCQKQCMGHIPYYLSGILRVLFSDNLSRNSCIQKRKRRARTYVLYWYLMSRAFHFAFFSIVKKLRN